MAKIKQDGYENFFYFMKRTTLLMLLSYLTRDSKQFLVFRKPKSYYEMLYVIYMRRSLEPDKKSSLLDRIVRGTEAGLFQDMYNRIEKDMVASLMKRLVVYDSLEDFVYDYTNVEIVQLENYKRIFAYQAVLLTGLFVIFIAEKSRWLRQKKRSNEVRKAPKK